MGLLVCECDAWLWQTGKAMKWEDGPGRRYMMRRQQMQEVAMEREDRMVRQEVSKAFTSIPSFPSSQREGLMDNGHVWYVRADVIFRERDKQGLRERCSVCACARTCVQIVCVHVLLCRGLDLRVCEREHLCLCKGKDTAPNVCIQKITTECFLLR